MDEEDFADVVAFVKRMGKETNQGEVGLEYDGSFFTVNDFS